MRIMAKANLGFILFVLLCLVMISTAAAKSTDNGYKEGSSADVEAFVHKNKGKIVVVNVFATWCSPCVTEVPDFVKTRNTYPENSVAMLGVSIDDSKPEVVSFIAEQKLNYPVYRVGEEFSAKYKIESIPQTYIHDRSGKLYKHFDGMISFEELQETIEKLLASTPESGDM